MTDQHSDPSDPTTVSPTPATPTPAAPPSGSAAAPATAPTGRLRPGGACDAGRPGDRRRRARRARPPPLGGRPRRDRGRRRRQRLGASTPLTGAAPPATVLGYVPAGSVDVRRGPPRPARRPATARSASSCRSSRASPTRSSLDTKLDEILDQLVGKASNGKQTYSARTSSRGSTASSRSASARCPTRRRSAAGERRGERARPRCSCRSRTRPPPRPGSTTLLTEGGATTTTTRTTARPSRSPAKQGTPETGIAIIDGKVAVIGDLASVKAAIDTKGAGAFAEEPGPKAALAAADGDHVGFVYLALGTLFDWSASLQSSMLSGMGSAAPASSPVRPGDHDQMTAGLLPDWADLHGQGGLGRPRDARASRRRPATAIGPTANRTSTSPSTSPPARDRAGDHPRLRQDPPAGARPLPVAAVLQGRFAQLEQGGSTWSAALDAILGWIGDAAIVVNGTDAAARGGHRGQAPTDGADAAEAPDQPQGPHLARWRPAGHQRPRGGPQRHDHRGRQPGLHRQARRVRDGRRRPRSRCRPATSSSPTRSPTTSSSSAPARASSSTSSTRPRATSLAIDRPLQERSPAGSATAPGSPSSTSRRSASWSRASSRRTTRPRSRPTRPRSSRSSSRSTRFVASSSVAGDLDHVRRHHHRQVAKTGAPQRPGSTKRRNAPDMAVRIRLTRVGATKQPTYRVVVADGRSARDGRVDRDARPLQPAHRAGRVRGRRRQGEGLARQGRPAVRHRRPTLPPGGHPARRQVGDATMAAKELVEYVAKSLVDDPDAVTVEVVRRGRRDRHRAPRRRGRHGQGHRAQRQRRQGAPDAAQGDRRPRRRAGPARDPLSVDERLVVALVRGVHGLHGAVRVEVLTDRPEDRFVPGAVLHREGADEPLTIAVGRGRRRRPRLAPPLPRGRRRATPPTRLRGAYLEAVGRPGRGPRPRRVLLARGRSASTVRGVGRRRARDGPATSTASARPRCFVVRRRAVRRVRPAGRPRLHPDLRAAPRRDRGRRRRRSTSVRAKSTTPDPDRPKAPRRRSRRPATTATAGTTEDASAVDHAGARGRRGRAAAAMTLEIDVLTLFPAMFEGPLGDEHPRPDPGAGPGRRSGSTTCATWGLGRHRSRRRRPVRRRSRDDPAPGAGRRRARRAAPPGLRRRSCSTRPARSSARPAPRTSPTRSHLVFVCPRYEGVDERIRSLVDLELSIGDYVLTGGELPALVVIDAVHPPAARARSTTASTAEESFTRRPARVPAVHAARRRSGAWTCPAILTSGDHGAVRRWRRRAGARPDARAPARPARASARPGDPD